jgi:hypothetical protein
METFLLYLVIVQFLGCLAILIWKVRSGDNPDVKKLLNEHIDGVRKLCLEVAVLEDRVRVLDKRSKDNMVDVAMWAPMNAVYHVPAGPLLKDIALRMGYTFEYQLKRDSGVVYKPPLDMKVTP